MHVLVCGGRNYRDRNQLFSALDAQHARHPITLIIHGAAKGADTLATEWAQARGIRVHAYLASWKDISHPDALVKRTRSGKPYDARAGHRRNLKMLEQGRPALVIAFRGGSGTADMVRRAHAARVRVVTVAPAQS